MKKLLLVVSLFTLAGAALAQPQNAAGSNQGTQTTAKPAAAPATPKKTTTHKAGKATNKQKVKKTATTTTGNATNAAATKAPASAPAAH
jgi:ABC-type Fe3+-hydroxamate transport system substrate-binding protein